MVAWCFQVTASFRFPVTLSLHKAHNLTDLYYLRSEHLKPTTFVYLGNGIMDRCWFKDGPLKGWGWPLCWCLSAAVDLRFNSLFFLGVFRVVGLVFGALWRVFLLLMADGFRGVVSLWECLPKHLITEHILHRLTSNQLINFGLWININFDVIMS